MYSPLSLSSGESEDDEFFSTAEESSDTSIDIKETISVITQDGVQKDISIHSESGSSTPTVPNMAARAYQLEMFEQSMRRNVIVAVCRRGSI